MSHLDYILIATLGQGYLLAFFLLASKYYRSTANTWLSVATALLATIGILDIVGKSYITKSVLVEFLINDLPLKLLVYIPLYFYFSASASNSKKKDHKHLFLFIPFLVDAILNLFLITNYRIEEFSTNSAIQIFYEVETAVALAFCLFLCYKSYQRIKTASGLLAAQKEWLLKIWQSTLAVILVWGVISFYQSFAIYKDYIVVPILYLTVSLWLFWIIYNGVVNLNLISDRKDIHLKLQSKTSTRDLTFLAVSDNTVPVEVDWLNVEKNSASIPEIKNDNELVEPITKKATGHFERIDSLVQTQSLYRDENLSINDLSERVGISPGYISQIIKSATNKSVPVWINEFRVAEVKYMLLNQEFQNYTITAIGLEAGFKSRSAFYATFKKMTGMTPAKFRQKQS